MLFTRHIKKSLGVISNSVCIQWGRVTKSNNNIISLPITYETYYNVQATTVNSHSAYILNTYEEGDGSGNKTLTSFFLSSSAVGSGSNKGGYWLTIGY